MKKHAVMKLAVSVSQTELFEMKQDHGESGRAFAAKLKGKARVCKLTKKCEKCPAVVDFSDEM